MSKKGHKGEKTTLKKTFKDRKNTQPTLYNLLVVGVIVAVVLSILNSIFIYSLNSKITQTLASSTGSSSSRNKLLSGDFQDKSIDVYSIKSTPQAIVASFPELKEATSPRDVYSIMLPKGTPEYSDKLGGISFDRPEESLQYLSSNYERLKNEVKSDPEKWQRYLKLAAAPRGISCEFCCGVGPQGINAAGDLRCGCEHNPALQALTLGLIKYTDYSDAEILREVMKWKTLFFPKAMISIATQLAGKDYSDISTLPGMVGEC